MIGGLKSTKRQVEQLGQAVRADRAGLGEAGRRIADRVHAELRRPKVLLVIFAAGLGFGWLRGGSRPRRKDEEGKPATGAGRLAELAAAAIAGARLVEEIRRAAELVGPLAGRSSSAPAAEAPSDDAMGQ
ncbi:MAG: hypothetical protein WBE98_18065 [Gammaproteobacteria bacterium]|nr:hypothetical protein [Gammaproteobacteria bacterium]